MATVLIVDDDAAMRDGLAETVGDLGHHVVTAADGAAALRRIAAEPPDAVLLDLRMPGLDGLEVLRRLRAAERPGDRGPAPPIAVLTAFADGPNTIEAMRLGAFDHLTKPVGRQEVADLVARMIASRPEPPPTGDVAGAPAGDAAVIAASAPMRAVLKTIGRVADSDVTVLITGETGTGKEIVAHALHRHSRRSTAPFVAVNCAAIPAELLESELFGHVRGAFTGAAADRRGSFRAAQGGTLLLDEIGDMDAAMQAKILRVLQERVVTPVGGRAEPIDIRIVAATHRDLPSRIRDGLFRADLYYRLNVVAIHLPPLRERLADILPLAESILAPRGKRLSGAAAARLMRHPWPGNVRELHNVIARAAVLTRDAIVEAADLDLDAHTFGAAPEPAPVDWLDGELPAAVARLEAAMIRRALDAAGGNRSDAARQLGIHRQLLYGKMEKYGIATDGCR